MPYLKLLLLSLLLISSIGCNQLPPALCPPPHSYFYNNSMETSLSQPDSLQSITRSPSQGTSLFTYCPCSPRLCAVLPLTKPFFTQPLSALACGLVSNESFIVPRTCPQFHPHFTVIFDPHFKSNTIQSKSHLLKKCPLPFQHALTNSPTLPQGLCGCSLQMWPVSLLLTLIFTQLHSHSPHSLYIPSLSQPQECGNTTLPETLCLQFLKVVLPCQRTLLWPLDLWTV